MVRGSMGPLQNASHIDSPPWLKNGVQKPDLRKIVELTVAPRNMGTNVQKWIRSSVAAVRGIRKFSSKTGNSMPYFVLFKVVAPRSPCRIGRCGSGTVFPGFAISSEAKNSQGISEICSFYFALRGAKGRIQIFYRDYRACLCGPFRGSTEPRSSLPRGCPDADYEAASSFLLPSNSL